MRKMLLLLVGVVLILPLISHAQLPPVAQALYDEAVVQDSAIVQYALNAGAQITATPDGNSFYVQWFPPGAAPETTPLIVSLHGSEGFAFHEFKNWHSAAISHGCGIVALQWFRGYSAVAPYDYFPDDTLYNYIDSALTRIAYPAGKAFLHGFSRGAARSYAMVFHDIQSGNNYFCTTMANSGGADLGYPLYAQINAGNYGPKVFAGKHWNFFCGGLDPNPNQSGCPAMTNTQSWLPTQGASVDIYIQDPSLGHDGFQLSTATSLQYRDSILENYVACFNAPVGIVDQEALGELQVFPNPSTGSAILNWGFEVQDGNLTIFNSCGQMVKRISAMAGKQAKLEFADLPSGLYWVQLRHRDQMLGTARMAILR